MRQKALLAAALAATLALAAPATAFADQIVKRFSPQESIPTTIVEDGVSYELATTMTARIEPEGTEQTKECSATRSISVAAADYNGDPASYLPATVSASEDGFAGEISLVGTDVKTLYSVESQTITRRETFRDLTQAEVDAIPDTKEYTAPVADRPGATGPVTFERVVLDVKPSQVSPGLFFVQAFYQGVGQTATVEGYEIHGSYSGELSKAAAADDVQEVVEAVYAAVGSGEDTGQEQAPKKTDAAANETRPAQEAPSASRVRAESEAEGRPNPAYFAGAALAGLAVAAAGGFGAFLLFSRRSGGNGESETLQAASEGFDRKAAISDVQIVIDEAPGSKPAAGPADPPRRSW